MEEGRRTKIFPIIGARYSIINLQIQARGKARALGPTPQQNRVQNQSRGRPRNGGPAQQAGRPRDPTIREDAIKVGLHKNPQTAERYLKIMRLLEGDFIEPTQHLLTKEKGG